jgi:hypothetical protein
VNLMRSYSGQQTVVLATVRVRLAFINKDPTDFEVINHFSNLKVSTTSKFSHLPLLDVVLPEELVVGLHVLPCIFMFKSGLKTSTLTPWC